jgi:hypothetical protein
MRIHTTKVLRTFRAPGYCEVCNLYCRKREPHHIRAKGMGGGGALNVPINLVSVGAVEKLPDGRARLSCPCHKLIHAGKINIDELLTIVARREGAEPETVREVLDWMRRTVGPTPVQLERCFLELSGPARELAERMLT